MFNLPQQASSINGSAAAGTGISKALYQKIDSTVAVNSTTFGASNVTFRWTLGGNQHWLPSQSFMRVRVSLTAADGKQLADAQAIAPNMGLCAHLWQNVTFKIGSTIVSRIDSDVAQVDALRTRLQKTQSYMEGLGQTLNFWDDSHTTRLQSITSDGQGRDLKQFECVWVPPMSIFDVGHALPGGSYELDLTPNTASIIGKSVIESLADKVSGTDFKFQVEDCVFYLATVDGPRSSDVSYVLDLREIRLQRGQISTSTSTQQRNFEISPNTESVTVCFQDNRQGTNSIYSSSRFRIDATPNDVAGDESTLQRLFINYAGQIKPVSGDAQFDFDLTAKRDYLVQRYYDSLINSGMAPTQDVESITQWLSRGAYYHFSWPRDGKNQDTRLVVNFQFSADASAGSLLLFDHYQRAFRVRVAGGRVVTVQEAV